MKKLLIFFAISCLVCSCETIVDDLDLNKFPILKEKIVVSSFISPQSDTILVFVTKSTPLFENINKSGFSGNGNNPNDTLTLFNRGPQIENAQVSIESKGITAGLRYSQTLKGYFALRRDFPILGGETYTLKVLAEKQTLEASTTVPLERPRIENLFIQKRFQIFERDFFGKDTVEALGLKFEFQDIINKTNYYAVWGELSSFERVPFVFNNEIKETASILYSYLRIRDRNFDGNGRYISDNLYQNEKIQVTDAEIVAPTRIACLPSGAICQKSKIVVGTSKLLKLQLWHVSKELYDFQTSLRKFNQASNNPFAEPVPVYSNIKNGLGIFASYNSREERREI